MTEKIMRLFQPIYLHVLIICSEIDSVADEYCKRFLEQDKKNTFGITNKIKSDSP